MMQRKEILRLMRSCAATAIPSGEPVMLEAGTEVRLFQTLGGNFTVQTERGELVRIDAKDADALGRTAPAPEQSAPTQDGGGAFEIDRVWDELRHVYDPEIPVNIVDLGLVYVCEPIPLPSGGYQVQVEMTMTAPGCGMGDVLAEDVRRRLLTLPGVERTDVRVVFEPPWTPERMSDAARLELGWM
jgi:probable FeS assembly SUF system protein SufT